MSIKSKIKEAQDLKKEIVQISEWDVSIEVRTMTAKQRAELFNLSMDEDGKFIQKNFQAGMVIASCYDPETGDKLFAPEDADWLMDKASGPIEKIINKVTKLSGLIRGALEQAEKN